jgi:hypothetical protein
MTMSQCKHTLLFSPSNGHATSLIFRFPLQFLQIEVGMGGAGGQLSAARPSSARAGGRVPIRVVTDRRARHVLRSYRLLPAKLRFANRHEYRSNDAMAYLSMF